MPAVTGIIMPETRLYHINTALIHMVHRLFVPTVPDALLCL